VREGGGTARASGFGPRAIFSLGPTRLTLFVCLDSLKKGWLMAGPSVDLSVLAVVIIR